MNDVDYVLETVDPWLSKYIASGPEALSELEKVGVGVWLLDAEVNNGGFDQYYFNTRGVLALDTVKSLRSIGAQETASMLEAANAEFTKLPLPEDRGERNRLLDEVREKRGFRALDTEYYHERENRIGLLARYLRGRRHAA
jgi:hypothetical protein